MVVIGQNVLYSGKINCIFDQIGCTLAITLYSGNLIVFGQNLLYFGRIGSIRANWLYLGNIVVVGRLVVFG